MGHFRCNGTITTSSHHEILDAAAALPAIEALLGMAEQARASDIHLTKRSDESTQTAFRINGVLNVVAPLATRQYPFETIARALCHADRLGAALPPRLASVRIQLYPTYIVLRLLYCLPPT